MKLPRDLSDADLIKRSERLEYAKTRQSGSHVRLTAKVPSAHHITAPLHGSLRVGILAAILSTIAKHHDLSLEEQLISHLQR
jgi:predicted RNA binding protein YcfA (HicA-like mRNA interferase family)